VLTKNIKLVLAAVFFSLLLSGCPEILEKTLKEQVIEAERISGYEQQ